VQQECAAVILGAIAGVRHQKKIGLGADDRLERGESAGATPRSPAALFSPVSASSELTRLSRPETQPRRDSGSTE
jgi:hypothetical protein